MSSFKIGTTKIDGGRKGGGLKHFSLESGNNLFRILPPLWSLADSDRYFKYWRIHWGFESTDGKNVPIVCTERKDKNKVVVERCPICDMVETARKELEFLRTNGATPEQLKQFEDSRVNRFDGRGAYYVYAVDANGDIGILKLKKSMKDAYEVKYKQLADEGIQADGVNGVYMNFIRSGEGRFNTRYTVEVALESDPNNPRSKRYKEHILTDDVVNKIEKTTVDLAKLYKYIPRDEMEALANSAEGEERNTLVDRIFGKGEQANDSVPAMQTSMAGTNARLVTKVEVDNNLSLTSRKPETPIAGSVANKPVSPALAAQVPASGLSDSAQAEIGKLSDEELNRVFNARFGVK